MQFACVALLWGGTNPFLKKAGVGVEAVEESSKILQSIKELWFLVKRWQVGAVSVI